MKKIGALLWFAVPLLSVANHSVNYEAAKNYIQAQQKIDPIHNRILSATKTLPPVSETATATPYYEHPEQLASDSVSKVNHSNTAGHTVYDQAFRRAKIQINTQSPEIQFGKNITAHASEIAQGTYRDCHQKNLTQSVSTEHTCDTPLPLTFSCIKKLAVSIEEQTIQQTRSFNLSATLHFNGASTVSMPVEAEQGTIKMLSMGIHNGANPWSCSQTYGLYLNGQLVGRYRGNCKKQLGDLQFAASHLTIPFDQHRIIFYLSGAGLSGSVSGNLMIEYPELHKVPIKTWHSSCVTLPAHCVLQKSRCVETNREKNIDGVWVSAPCWQQVDTLYCGAELSAACRQLQKAGCTQIGSACREVANGICRTYQETWSCSDQKMVGAGLQCGARFFCIDGDCDSASTEKNTAFGLSATKLSAVNEAGEAVREQGAQTIQANDIRIFTGKSARCRDVMLGALNCCADRGWAKGIFANCTDEEKKLGHAKEQGGLVVYIGRYCSTKALAVCIEHKKTYCIFPSRIATDVQVGGRESQLHHSFGDAKAPDCSGLTPTEIGHLNFDRIDFSNAVADVSDKKQLPDSASVQARIQNQINENVLDAHVTH